MNTVGTDGDRKFSVIDFLNKFAFLIGCQSIRWTCIWHGWLYLQHKPTVAGACINATCLSRYVMSEPEMTSHWFIEQPGTFSIHSRSLRYSTPTHHITIIYMVQCHLLLQSDRQATINMEQFSIYLSSIVIVCVNMLRESTLRYGSLYVAV